MYKELIKELRDYAASRKGEIAELTGKAAGAIEGLNNLCMDLQGELKRTRSDYNQGKELQEELKAGLVEMIERIPRWIPVTERLPKEDGWYQVYAPSYSGGSSSGLKNINGNMYSAFKHGKWSIEVGYHKRPGCVKAWMPLPEPPKEE